MTQCKAVTGNNVQCKNSAKEGLELCGIHDNTAYAGAVMTMPKKDQYKIMILDVGSKSLPPAGFSGREVVALLQGYYDDGYELFAVNDGGLHELPGSTSKDYFSVMYTFKLRE